MHQAGGSLQLLVPLHQFHYLMLTANCNSQSAMILLAKSLEGMPIDLLINNAGIFKADDQRPDDHYSVDRQSFLKVLEIDTVSQVLVTKTFLPNLKQSPTGTVVNISSYLGSITLCSNPNYLAYATAKAALNMATKIMAIQLKDELRGHVHSGNRTGLCSD